MLGVAAVVCVSSAVAGEMLQDLKVGHILGGTPWRMQVGDLIGVVVAGALLFFPLYVLHFSNIAQGGTGFGDRALSAPQAGLMATLAQGIVGGEMAWPLVIVGIAMGLSLILIQVRSPMLFAVGMYLPLETTFAIFVGGMIRGYVDSRAKARGYNDAQRARVENSGVLVASGLIAGEALMGLVVAAVVFFRNSFPSIAWGFASPMAIVFAVVLAAYLVLVPLVECRPPRRARAADGDDVASLGRSTAALSLQRRLSGGIASPVSRGAPGPGTAAGTPTEHWHSVLPLLHVLQDPQQKLVELRHGLDVDLLVRRVDALHRRAERHHVDARDTSRR